jgi:acetyl/propionyl-CoA carboxylase alpha subunit
LPDIGTLETYSPPKGIGVRVDDSYEEGMEIPIYYDPMIAKLITFGRDREEAMDKMIRAIDDYTITGIETTLPFGSFVMKHEAFRSGNFDTHFVNKYFTPESLNIKTEDDEVAMAIVAHLFDKEMSKQKFVVNTNTKTRSEWRRNR